MAFLAETSVKYAAQTPYMVDFAKIPVHVTANYFPTRPSAYYARQLIQGCLLWSHLYSVGGCYSKAKELP